MRYNSDACAGPVLYHKIWVQDMFNVKDAGTGHVLYKGKQTCGTCPLTK